MILPYTEFNDTPSAVQECYKIGTGRKMTIINAVNCGFDIETTNDDTTHSAYMYIWQFAVNQQAYYGRTWDEFFIFMEKLRKKFDGKIFVFIHNMGFEMSFLLPRLHRLNMIDRLFAKTARQPLEIVLKNGIVFRDSMALTNMSLSALARAYCHTQKLVGDLDYTIPRNHFTPLTDSELAYCENDVLILSEYAQYLHDNYTRQGQKIPLTLTGIVRRLVKNQIDPTKIRYVKKQTARLFPETLDEYDREMTWLFRGGFTHAQTAICGEILTNVDSHDLKSAYPAEMCHRLYPMTPFRTANPDNALDYIKFNLAVIMVCTFTNITATGAHVLESRHKILDSKFAEYENGRLYHANEITVILTDVDFAIYKMMYKWDDLIIHGCKIASKKPLPDYILKPLFSVYSEKERIGKLVKSDSDNNDIRQQYMSIKGQLNSFYGMTVARLNLSEWEYNGEWVEKSKSSYEKERNNSILSPYWGIYITAYTRLTICTAIVALGDSAYYSDTDSIKHAPTNEYFNNFNAIINNINMDMCKTYDLEYSTFAKLGTFDFECTYSRFKTLGAKRYIYEIDGKLSCTVAGLPKNTFTEYAQKIGNDLAFEKFAPNMRFTVSGKNAHTYTDECDTYINGKYMHEYGSCYIFSVPFEMRVDTGFLLAITARRRYTT